MGNEIAAIFFLYAMGTAGCITFKKLNLPLPGLLGSLIVTAILAVAGLFPEAPIYEMSSVCKIILGIVIGCRINRESVRLLSGMIFPALLVSVWMVVLSVFMGFFISWLSGMPLSTTLTGAATGGISEMAIFAMSMNYDVATSTMLQVFRLVVVLALTPWIVKKGAEKLGYVNDEAQSHDNELPAVQMLNISKGGILALAAVSATGGFLFEALHIPAGFMLGSLFFTSIYFLVSNRRMKMHNYILYAVQIGLGISIAEHFKPGQFTFQAGGSFLLSVFACIVITLIGSTLLAFILYKLTGWDPLTCLLSTSAGGITQMTLVSEEMKADSLKVGMLHLVRYLAIIYCMPIIIKLILP